jgi:hypothetical protein
MRYQYIDNLRALENLLRCCIHAIVPFMLLPNPIYPMRASSGFSQIYDAGVFLIHCQTMEVFFAINGFFAMLLWAKNTPKSFIINRLYRIGLPFLLGLLIWIPFISSLALSWKNHSTFGEAIVLILDYFSQSGIPLAHLWSLFYLFPMYFLFILGLKKLNLKAFLEEKTPLQMLIGVGSAAAVLLMIYRRKFSSAPIENWLEWEMLLYFFAYFILGVWFFIVKEKMQNIKPKRYLWVVFILSIAVNLSYQVPDFQRFTFLKIIGPIAYAIQSLCSLIYIWYGMKRITWRPIFLQKFADSTYWIYWIELPLVMLSHWLFIDKIPSGVLIICTISVVFTFGYFTFHLFLKNSVWGKSNLKIK